MQAVLTRVLYLTLIGMTVLRQAFLLFLTMRNGIYGNMALNNVTFYPEMYQIDDLRHNRSDPDTKELANAIFDEKEMADDFAELFNRLSVKICWALTISTDFFIRDCS